MRGVKRLLHDQVRIVHAEVLQRVLHRRPQLSRSRMLRRQIPRSWRRLPRQSVVKRNSDGATLVVFPDGTVALDANAQWYANAIALNPRADSRGL